jgi:hypothetical protein
MSDKEVMNDVGMILVPNVFYQNLNHQLLYSFYIYILHLHFTFTHLLETTFCSIGKVLIHVLCLVHGIWLIQEHFYNYFESMCIDCRTPLNSATSQNTLN